MCNNDYSAVNNQKKDKLLKTTQGIYRPSFIVLFIFLQIYFLTIRLHSVCHLILHGHDNVKSQAIVNFQEVQSLAFNHIAHEVFVFSYL